MISFFEASLVSLCVHRVGNKISDEYFVLSEQPLSLDQEQTGYLMQYLLSPFEKVNEVYNLYHPNNDLYLNEVYSLASQMHAQGDFLDLSKQIAKHLYESSNHPKIKGGELYVAYFENIQMDGQLHNAVGIFKSETKEAYLKVNPTGLGFDLSIEQEAINLHSLDKGCLILNTDATLGFKVVCVDQSNARESAYWKDEFLRLMVISNDYHRTASVLEFCKHFATNVLDDEFEVSKADKVDILNRSLQYFKDKEAFDLEEFTAEVIRVPAAISSFVDRKSIYDSEFDLDIPPTFPISSAAVKKQAKNFKPIIKLDKNFHVYAHGDRGLLEKGYDEEKRMNYYKLYFKEEA